MRERLRIIANKASENEITDAVAHLTKLLKKPAKHVNQIYTFGANSIDGLDTWLSNYRSPGAVRRTRSAVVKELMDSVHKNLRQIAKNRKINPKMLASFDRTLALRKSLQVFLGRYECYRPALAQWIVQKWGKVDRSAGKKRSQAATNKKYQRMVRDAENWNLKEGSYKSFDHDTISQWSKYLAFRFPDKAAIYDSRVVHTLNWYLRDAKCPMSYPPPDSRNSLVNLLDHTIPRAVARHGWDKFHHMVTKDIDSVEVRDDNSAILSTLKSSLREVKPKQAYSSYLDVLNRLSKTLFPGDDWALTKVEMLLFGLAKVQVSREVLAAFANLGKTLPRNKRRM